MPSSVALGSRFENFVREQVGVGRYNNVSEVVRDGLRLLEQRQREDAAKLKALEQAVAAGVAAIDAGEFELLEKRDVGAFVARLGEERPHRAGAVPKRLPGKKTAAQRAAKK